MGGDNYEADYELEFESSSKDDILEEMERIGFSESIEDYENDDDDDEQLN